MSSKTPHPAEIVIGQRAKRGPRNNPWWAIAVIQAVSQFRAGAERDPTIPDLVPVLNALFRDDASNDEQISRHTVYSMVEYAEWANVVEIDRSDSSRHVVRLTTARYI